MNILVLVYNTNTIVYIDIIEVKNNVCTSMYPYDVY